MNSMPFLIDGNNLLHALAARGGPIGQVALCRRLEALAAAEGPVWLVFDGPPPAGPPAGEFDALAVRAAWSGRREADEILLRHIAASTAPRRLVVVSTDRQIRRAARRRRCKVVRSEDFARQLLQPAPPPGPAEPDEKRHGPDPDQADAWLREFGLAPDEPIDPFYSDRPGRADDQNTNHTNHTNSTKDQGRQS